MSTEIDWGYNCLTQGVHHGRPEAIWNLPLLQTMKMFSPVQLQQLVVDRIYNDAMQYVEHGNNPRPSKEWAEKLKEVAAPLVLHVYQRKIGEITKYYLSPGFKHDLDNAVDLNKQNKLNSYYAPLHDHDTINMLCRIVGSSGLREVRKVQ
jgi:hypothetical protein